ncbi:MAG: SBBP repeat-containing protein [Candidatus Hodarchaeales archaeon]|jgi:hypothetical protein
MKIKKIYLVLFVFGLSLSFVFPTSNTFFNKVNSRNNEIKTPFIYPSDLNTNSWNKTWGSSDLERGYGVALDSSEDIYVSGYTYGIGAGSSDIALVKYNGSGVLLWNRTWGGSGGDSGGGVTVDSSDDFYVTGLTNSFGAGGSDITLVKYSSSGVLLWNRTWGGSSNDRGYEVTFDSSDNIYVTGSTNSFGAGNSDMVLVKYSSSGVQLWNRTWGGIDSDLGLGVAVDSSDNIFVTGNTPSFGVGGTDMFLVKYNSSGAQLWNKTWGGSSSDGGHGVTVDSYENVYVSGGTQSFGIVENTLLVKYNNSGVQLWNRTWSGSNGGSGLDVTVDSANIIYLTGDSNTNGIDIVLLKYNSSGVLLWNRTWGGNGLQRGFNVAVDSIYNAYIVGYTSVGNDDIIIAKSVEEQEININNPLQNDYYAEFSPLFDISIVESHLDGTWYTLDNGVTNITFRNLIGAINQTEWEKQGDGLVNIRFHMNNTLGKEKFAEVTIFKDTHNPEIVINSPSQHDLFRNNAPDYDISVTEPNLESIWYSIDDGTTNFSITELVGTIDQAMWNSMQFGNITLRFYARDLAGNIGYSEITIERAETKDNAIPGYHFLLLISVTSVLITILRKKKQLSNK